MPIMLNLQGVEVNCLTQGNPESGHIFLTIGPGSLYFPIYSDTLKQHSYFVAYDEPWIHKKGSPVDHEATESISLQSMIDDIRRVVVSLKATFPDKKIHLVANSIVTGLALSCAQSIDELDGTLCIGTPLKPISPDFFHVKKDLSQQALSQLEKDMTLFNAMLQGECLKERLPQSNVESGRLTPNSEFVEQCQSLRVAVLKDYQHYDKVVAHMWRHPPNRPEFVINLAVREHFFKKLQGKINISDMLDNLNARKAKVFLAWGESDGVTPYNLTLLKNWPNIAHGIFANAGHFPQLEAHQAFDEDILRFIEQKPQAHLRSLLRG